MNSLSPSVQSLAWRSGRSPALPYPPASNIKYSKYCLCIKQNTKFQSKIPVIINKNDNTKKILFFRAREVFVLDRGLLMGDPNAFILSKGLKIIESQMAEGLAPLIR